MYELLDKPSAIKEIQRYLYIISDRVNTNVPRVAIDGIYGEETKNAVYIFQTEYEIAPTAEVDLRTFEMLVKLSSEAIKKNESKDRILTDAPFPFKRGDQGADVLIINTVLNELRNTYQDIGRTERSNYFSHNTERNVIEMQKIFRTEATGEVDRDLYLRMQIELDAINRLAEIYE